MSFAGLLNHQVTVYRKTETTGLIGSVDRSWSVNASAVKAAVQVKAEMRADPSGAGEQVVGTYRVYAASSADIVEGDILKVTAGPGSFGYLLAQSVYKPRGHHTEITATQTTEDPTQ
jgi:hypothetical protein